MPIRINLKELFDSDSQSITVDRLNFNFNKLLELGIGLPGDKGVTGPQGGVGPAGLQGPIGDDGNYWFVGAGDPNTQTFTDLEDNDFYLDTSNSSIWQYDASINTWNVVVDFAAVVNNYLNSLGTTFIRGLGAGSPDDNRYILFPNRGNTIPDTATDGLGGTSNNDILFLSNFNEKLGVINIANFPTNSDNLYNAIQKIYVDSTTGIPGRYHLELGSLYQDTNGTLDNLISSLKTNLKFRHVVDDLGGSSNFPATNNYLYLGKISLSKPELALIGEIDYNAALEIITPKYNNEGAPVVRGEVVTRIGSKEALGEYFTGLNIDGLTIDLSGLTGKVGIGIASNFSNIRPEVDGLDYLMLEKDSSIEAIYLNGKTLQDRGNIEQLSTGDVSIKTSVIDTNALGSHWRNQGMAIAGTKVITVSGDRSVSSLDQTGRISLYDISNPINPIPDYQKSINSNTQIPNKAGTASIDTTNILGAGLADVQIAGEYAYFINNQDIGTSAGLPPVAFQTKSFSNFQIGRIWNKFNKFDEIDRVSYLSIPELTGAHRLEVRGKWAWVITNLQIANVSTSNRARLTSIDISNPTAPVLGSSYQDNQYTRYLAMDVADGQVAVLKSTFSPGAIPNSDLVINLCIFDASNPNAILGPAKETGPAAATAVESFNAIALINGQRAFSFGGIKLFGKYAYIAWGKALYIYDTQIGVGTQPIKMSETNLGLSIGFADSYAIDIEIIGTTAYVLAWDDPSPESGASVIIKIDVSDVQNPYIISKTYLTGLAKPGRLKYSGKYLYVASVNSASPTIENGGLFVIEVDGIRSPGAHIDSIRTGKLQVDKNAVIQENLTVNQSLNVGPGGIYVDAGEGISADGLISSTKSFRTLKLNQNFEMDIKDSEFLLFQGFTGSASSIFGSYYKIRGGAVVPDPGSSTNYLYGNLINIKDLNATSINGVIGNATSVNNLDAAIYISNYSISLSGNYSGGLVGYGMASQADQLNGPTASLFSGAYVASTGSATKYGINIEGDDENTVDGNFRVGGDYITGSDPVGWQNHLLTNANMAYFKIFPLPANAYATGIVLDSLTTTRNLLYKVIGKTVHISFRLENFVIPGSFPTGTSRFIYIELPSSIYPKSSTYRYFFGNAAWNDVSLTGSPVPALAGLYKGSDISLSAPASKYYIYVRPSLADGGVLKFTHSDDPLINLYGSITYELP
jgi:hypothetical protein